MRFKTSTSYTGIKINRSEIKVLVKRTGEEDGEAKVTITTPDVKITFMVSRAWSRLGGEGWAIDGTCDATVKTRKEVIWNAIQNFNAGRLQTEVYRRIR